LREQKSDVRTIELVGRSGQEVATQGLHVEQHVRRGVHRVDE
jgi:hypothetical protein